MIKGWRLSPHWVMYYKTIENYREQCYERRMQFDKIVQMEKESSGGSEQPEWIKALLAESSEPVL